MPSVLINHQQFVESYKSGTCFVLVDKSKAGNFVMSSFGDKYNKPGHIFWTWLGILLFFPAPILIYIYFGWLFAACSIFVGLLVTSAARKTASQLVLNNMIEDEDFWDFVLLHKGAVLRDDEGNTFESEYLERMAKKTHT